MIRTLGGPAVVAVVVAGRGVVEEAVEDGSVVVAAGIDVEVVVVVVVVVAGALVLCPLLQPASTTSTRTGTRTAPG